MRAEVMGRSCLLTWIGGSVVMWSPCVAQGVRGVLRFQSLADVIFIITVVALFFQQSFP